MTGKLYYLQNLKVFLTFVVVAHHWAIANGGPGDWYNSYGPADSVSEILLGIFIAGNQAYFMGFFFIISGFFVPGSFQKHTSSKLFLLSRIKRLLLPWGVYTFVFTPLIRTISSGNFTMESFHSYFIQNMLSPSSGPLWFVLLLFMFNVLFSLIHKHIHLFSLSRKNFSILFISLIAIIFLIRIKIPVGYWVPVLNIQPAHFIQYLFCFFIGTLININDMEIHIYLKNYKRYLILGLLTIIIGLPTIVLFNGFNAPHTNLKGGLNITSLFFTIWEQMVCVLTIIGLTGLFYIKFNINSATWNFLSKHSFSIYFTHSLALVSYSVLIKKLFDFAFLNFISGLIPLMTYTLLIAIFAKKAPILRRIL